MAVIASYTPTQQVVRHRESYLDRWRAERRRMRPCDTLTPRELDVLGLIVEGYSNADIGTQILTEESTVKRHLTSIMEKTGMSSRLELAIFAIANGIAIPDTIQERLNGMHQALDAAVEDIAVEDLQKLCREDR